MCFGKDGVDAVKDALKAGKESASNGLPVQVRICLHFSGIVRVLNCLYLFLMCTDLVVDVSFYGVLFVCMVGLVVFVLWTVFTIDKAVV